MQKSVNSNQGLVLFNTQIGHLPYATTPGQSGPGSDENKGVLHIPQPLVLLEPHNQIVWCHI